MDLAAIDHLLTTTRSVRKRLDLERPVEPEIIQECLEIAIQAPTGSNLQTWRFVVVTDPEKRAAIAKYYSMAWKGYIATQNVNPVQVPEEGSPLAQTLRVFNSANYLAENLHRVPVFVIPCIKDRLENSRVVSQASLYGSILPAAWSLMLALRSRGLGSSWTTLHLAFEEKVAEILGIPKGVTQTALLPIAYYKGEDFKPAKRLPAKRFTYWDAWKETRE